MKRIGDHAIVIGASMGGLLAARALADDSKPSRCWSGTYVRLRMCRARAYRRATTRTACWRAGAA